jgi:hypothetical protein
MIISSGFAIFCYFSEIVIIIQYVDPWKRLRSTLIPPILDYYFTFHIVLVTTHSQIVEIKKKILSFVKCCYCEIEKIGRMDSKSEQN